MGSRVSDFDLFLKIEICHAFLESQDQIQNTFFSTIVCGFGIIVSKNQKRPFKELKICYLEVGQYGSDKIQNFMQISGSEEIIKKKYTEKE
jgi:hypothetical protein